LKLCSAITSRSRSIVWDVIDEARCRIGHAARGARRADAAAFTREGDEDLVGAGLAANAGEAVGKEATAQIGGEFAVDVAGQAAAVGIAELGEQGLGVARDELVQDGALGDAPLVAAGQRLSGGAGRAFVEGAGEHGRAA